MACISLATEGITKVSDFKEFTFEDFGQLMYTTDATTTVRAATRYLNLLQRRKLVLIPL